MKNILPNALFIGFTGTPLLKQDKQRSIENFGNYIHTYKFNQAVADKIVLDLRYEARDIDQNLTSETKIDQWFDAKTRGLSDLAKTQLKQKWGTMQKLLSSKSRLEQIVDDILLDMERKPRLMDGRGNAMLVCSSIYQACKIYELFSQTELKSKCAIITSYKPAPSDIKGEETGEGYTEKLRQYEIYRKMLADYFNDSEDKAMCRVEEFETDVKNRFIKEPGQMRLLIVVDKLLTGFDAPPATYLYIDKNMQDHGLFQAICRVNRLDGEDKEYGYIVDYKNLFKKLKGAIADYTSGALDGYDAEDVVGLLTNRLEKGKERLDETLEIVRALCETVPLPRHSQDYYVFGHRYRMEVIERPGNHEVVIINNNIIQLFVNPGTSPKNRALVLTEWYRQQLKLKIPDLLNKWQSIIGEQVSDWGIKKMKTKWGSCNIKERRIWLNLELAKKPIECLEYVLVHELVHLLERHHNERFQSYMDQYLPQWRQCREILNQEPLGDM